MANSDFVYEGHFTNEATWDIPKRFKAQGYQINMIFLGLINTGVSQLRVASRAKAGGHFVNAETVESNFYGNLEKLNQHYPMFDNLQIMDTSERKHIVLCVFVNGEVESTVPPSLLPLWFQTNLPALTEKIKTRWSK